MELIGRDDVLSSIRDFFGDDGVGGRALLVVGDAGVGKTAVLDTVADEMGGGGRARTVRANGAQFEVEVGYSTLNQLLLPVTDELSALSAAHRKALRRALGLDVGPAPDRLVVSTATLMLLRAVSATTPVLIVVDDLHWVDHASAEVLSFVARRLTGTSIHFLAACRPAERGFFRNCGLTEFPLAPLAADAARTLVDRNFPDLAPAVRRRLLSEAAGNPLALLELPSALDHDQRTDFTALPAVLPLPERLQSMFMAQVRGLPDRCRLMMLLGALGGTTEPARLREAGGDACDLDDLAAAERAGLVRVNAPKLSLRHPLVAAAVVAASSPQERRWAHAALADAHRDAPERRIKHLAESAAGPDAWIAGELEAAAHILSRRGEAIGAVSALTKAAELTADPAERGRRLAEAASIGADAGGELVTAGRLLDDARRTGLPAHSLPAATAAAHLLINTDGDVPAAHRLLAEAIEAGDHGFDGADPDLYEALHTLLLLSWWVATDAGWQTFFALFDRLTPGAHPVLRVTAAIFPDPARARAEDLADLDALVDQAEQGDDPTQTIRVGTAAVFADRLRKLRGLHRYLARKGPARRHLGALMHLGLDGYGAGRWEEARAAADEGLAVCDEHGFRFFRWYFRYVHSMVAAGRGEVRRARQLTDGLMRSAIEYQAPGIAHFALHTRALADIGAGDFESAYENAARLSPPGQLVPHRPTVVWSAIDLVEAALHTGRTTEAAAHANAMQATVGLSPRARMLALAAAAMTSGAGHGFDEALAVPGGEAWPFDFARVRLAYGERLRRLRLTGEAREQLSAAHEAFVVLGADPWSGRAESELRATGMNRQAKSIAAASLTPQERAIAELAGGGLTNKQIAQRLFLSHRTVGDHLYKIFPKLGITSRAALRDALNPAGD